MKIELVDAPDATARGKPGAMVIIATRVGQASHVPRGWTTGLCSFCEMAVWLSPDTLELAERWGMDAAPVCTGCLEPTDAAE